MSTTTHGRADSTPSATSAATGRNLAAFVARAWKLRATGSELVPAHGPVILASNHTAFLDGLFLVAASPRPVHVLVSADIAVAPFARALSASGQIAMASDVPDRHALGRARDVLDQAGVVDRKSGHRSAAEHFRGAKISAIRSAGRRASICDRNAAAAAFHVDHCCRAAIERRNAQHK